MPAGQKSKYWGEIRITGVKKGSDHYEAGTI
jgi:hypothetical protein